MKKADIITAVQEIVGGTKKESATYVDAVLEAIMSGVAVDGVVDIHGFAKFEKIHKDSKTARNPMTGEAVHVPAKDVPKCTFKKAFKDVVNA